MTAKSNCQLPYCRLLLIGIGLELRNHVQKKSNKLHFLYAQHPLPSLQNSNAGSSTPQSVFTLILYQLEFYKPTLFPNCSSSFSPLPHISNQKPHFHTPNPQKQAAFKNLQKSYKNSNSISIGDFLKSYPQCSHVLYLKN